VDFAWNHTSVPHEFMYYLYSGLVLEPSKSYAQVVDTPFHVSMAALDLKNSDNQGV